MDNETTNEATGINSEDSNSIEMCLEISRLEYEYSFRRAEKFDNKVYILLTVCGFMFVMFMNAVSNIGEIDIFSPSKSGWILAYDVLLVLNIMGMMTVLVRLVSALSGLKLKRNDSKLILQGNMMSKSLRDIAIFTIVQYETAKSYNNVQIAKRYESLNTSVNILIAVVIMLILITVTGSFAVKL